MHHLYGNDYGKKESVFESKKVAQDQINCLFAVIIEYHKKQETLVYLKNIYNNYIKYPRWKDLPELIKLFFIFQYAQENSFVAFTGRVSPNLSECLMSQRYPEDFLRRRINANLKNCFGSIVLYSFTLEDLRTNAHLHGIIQNCFDIEKLKNILKRTFLGKNYRNSSINNFCLKFTPLNDASRWLAYILKRNSFSMKLFPVYVSRKLNRLVKEQYLNLKG